MPTHQKNYPIFTKAERDSWNSKMGRHYLQTGNLWQFSDTAVDFDLKIGELGQSRVVDLNVGPCEVFTNPDYKNNSNRPGILEEFYVSSGSIDIEFENTNFKLNQGDILIFDDSSPPVKFKVNTQTHIINIFMPQVVLKSWMPRTYDKLHHTLLVRSEDSSKLLGEYLELLAEYVVDKKKKKDPYPKSIVPVGFSSISAATPVPFKRISKVSVPSLQYPSIRRELDIVPRDEGVNEMRIGTVRRLFAGSFSLLLGSI